MDGYTTYKHNGDKEYFVHVENAKLLEGFNEHGVFIYTLLEALRGKGFKEDDKITTNELSDYVEKILPDRTYKKWGYRQLPQKVCMVLILVLELDNKKFNKLLCLDQT